MSIFKKKQPVEKRDITVDSILLSAFLNKDEITAEQAKEIPSYNACMELISSTVASLQIKLYCEKDGKTEEIKNDKRVTMLNSNTGDLLNGFQLKKAMVKDYLSHGAGYSYINRVRNKIASLNYVENNKICVNQVNFDPIFKDYQVQINGKIYEPWQFLHITRTSENGIKGKGILSENNLLLSVCYHALKYENGMMQTGNKRGFLQSADTVDPETAKSIKEQWHNLYTNNCENMVFLNSGITFKEFSNTSVEMQLVELKNSNSIEMCKIFNVPPSLISNTGSTSAEDKKTFVQNVILPILTCFESACDHDLLTYSEQNNIATNGVYYFKFDSKELLKASPKEQAEMYQIALNSGYMQIDEVRNMENLEPLGIDFVKIAGLDSIFYNPKTKGIYIPNTKESVDMNEKSIQINDSTVVDNNSNEGGEKTKNEN